MVRKTEMPEDVRRMTAEMRKAHDNPDPRPQLKRRNTKAVSAAEDAAMLARLRDRRGGQSDESKWLNDAAKEALSSACFDGIGEILSFAGRSIRDFVIRPLYNSRTLPGRYALEALKTGEVIGPSSGIRRFGSSFSAGDEHGVEFLVTRRASVPGRFSDGKVAIHWNGATPLTSDFLDAAGKYIGDGAAKRLMVKDLEDTVARGGVVIGPGDSASLGRVMSFAERASTSPFLESKYYGKIPIEDYTTHMLIDKSKMSPGHIKMLTDAAEKKGIPYSVYDGSTEVRDKIVRKYAERLRQSSVDWANDGPVKNVVWAHPAMGKTTLAKSGTAPEVVDFDSSYKSKLGDILVGHKWTSEAEKKAFRKAHEDLWERAVLDLFDEAVKDTAASGKTLLVSDVSILKKRGPQLDRVLTMPEELFLERSAMRGDTNVESMRGWKRSIDSAIESFNGPVESTEKFVGDALGLGVRQAAKGGNAPGESKSSGVRQAAGGGAAKISYEDLRKLADATYKGDVRAAVYSLDPKVITATVDSFGGNIDRTNRPMYVHRDKDGKITGYSTTNSGDALDRGVKPEGRFQSVLVPFVRQGKDGPEYTEDYNVAQKWYDESGQHYGKFDMDFTTPEAKARSIDRFNAASWLVHREQQLRYQPEFDKFVEAERRQAAKAGDAGRSESSGVPSGHNPALDGYGGPRVVINPTTFKNEKDGLCVAFNEAFRIVMEANGFDPVAEPTEKQRQFFADTAYNDDERMLRRTILARICTFDTSVTDPTDEQLQEAVEFLDTVLEIGAPQNKFEQRAVERIRTAISQALESGERVSTSQAPAPEGSPEVAAGGAGSSAGGVPEDEEKDSGAEFRENARAQMDEAAKLAQEGPTAEEQKMQAMAGAAGKVAGDDPFGKSEEMKAAVQEAGLKADIAEAQKPENLMQKNGHYVDAQGRVISERAAKALAEQGVRNAAAQDTNNQQQAPTQTASERTGTTSGIKTPGGRELTAGEAAWQVRKQASTEAWMQRTGRSGDGVADALAQRDEWANNLRRVDSGRRDALGRRLDDKGRVIA